MKTYFPLSRAQVGVCAMALAPVFGLIGCLESSSVSSYGPSISAALQVVPAAALSAAREGNIEESLYSYDENDGFLDQTYVMYGDRKFNLAVVNNAEINDSTLGVNGNKLQVVNGLNDVHEVKVLVEVKDITKLTSMSVNGHVLLPADFAMGTPTINQSETFDSGTRLPGAYAILTVGVLPAQTDIPLEVLVDGDCEVTAHFDSFGKAYCENTLVNAMGLGTTVIVKNEKCNKPSPSPSPIPSPSCTPSVGQDSSCSPSPSPSPSSSPSPTPSSSPSPIPSPDKGCTRTIGYWKTHAGFGSQADKVTALLPQWLGTANASKSFNVNTNTLAVEILSENVYGDASNGITKLYAQLLGAKLNGAAGAGTASISGAIDQADVFLATHDYLDWSGLSSTDQTHVLDWKTLLDSYNNGLVGPKHCD